MKKAFLLIIVLFFSLFCVNAKIEINNIEEYYAIGDEIKPTIQITSDIDVLALVSAELICDEYSKLYFIQPLELKEDNPVLVKVPPLKIYDKMLGVCILDVYLDSIIGAKLEKDWSEQFDILKERPVEEIIEENITEEITESKITDELITEEEPKEIIKEEPKEKTSRAGLYIFLLILLLILASYFYLKYKISNKNKFNKGWKI